MKNNKKDNISGSEIKGDPFSEENQKINLEKAIKVPYSTYVIRILATVLIMILCHMAPIFFENNLNWAKYMPSQSLEDTAEHEKIFKIWTGLIYYGGQFLGILYLLGTVSGLFSKIRFSKKNAL